MKFLIRVIGVTIVFFICYIIAGLLTNVPSGTDTDTEASFILFLLHCLLLALFLSLIIRNSHWSGIKLILGLLFFVYGIMTFMSLIEASFFMTNIPAEIIPQLWLMGAVVVVISVPLAVLIHGKATVKGSDNGIHNHHNFSVKEWVWKTVVIILSYLVIYFVFGYYIAWQSAELREFYGSTELVPFFPHLWNVAIETTLIPFQVLRAVLWMLFAMPLIWMLKGGAVRIAIITGFSISVIHSTQLLLPNPYMPETIRHLHLLETSTSMFLFGLLLGLLLHRPKVS